ncbi:MAG: hypothetical protein D6741_07980 [Planctomycetota bacterium]|nr:MAG: hypothetical protein D6741_07980 [Planctomycetota bacterium]
MHAHQYNTKVAWNLRPIVIGISRGCNHRPTDYRQDFTETDRFTKRQEPTIVEGVGEGLRRSLKNPPITDA